MITNYIEKNIIIKSYFNWLRLEKIPEHKLSYLEWGDPNNHKVVFCVHGLSRNAHDFDKLAYNLSKNFRVICIDIVGRGNSDWFKNKNHYNYHTYIKDCIYLLNQINIKKVLWIGTSMGGLLGMAIAALKPSYVKCLILNDIGAEIPGSQLKKINNYINENPTFRNLKEVKSYFKKKFRNFGIIDEEDWNRLVKFSSIIDENSQYCLKYDPKITKKVGMNNIKNDMKFWFLWKKVYCPVLVIHGAISDILTNNIINKMKLIRNFDLYTICNVGHAPALMNKQEIMTISSWLNQKITTNNTRL